VNKLIYILFFILAVGCTKSSNSHTEHSTEKAVKTVYTCSMHPSVREDKPGKCPICHMNLTKIEIDESESDHDHSSKNDMKTVLWRCKDYPDVTSEVEEACPIDGSMMVKAVDATAAEVVAKVKLRKAQLNHFRPSYFPVTTMKMSKKIRLLGSVLQSEEKESSIPARVGGRVEKVYVKSTGSFVKVGDPVVDIYSPKLITAGEEYLLARESSRKSKDKGFKEMLSQTVEKLKLWGIKSSQYELWYKNKNVPKQITIYSNATGIVRKRNASVGSYFKEGQNFFELSDLSDVWVEMDVYEREATLVEIGQEVVLEFTSLPGEFVTGVVDFINPVLDSKSRTLKVRTTIKNVSGKLKPGMIANAVLKIEMNETPLVVPRSAIIDTGKRKVVWTKVSDKEFKARVIHSGFESDGYVEVKSGLSEGDQVVIEGSFLLDAQAQLFGGYEDMPNTNDKKTHNH